jgi:hypothetical protein
VKIPGQFFVKIYSEVVAAVSIYRERHGQADEGTAALRFGRAKGVAAGADRA